MPVATMETASYREDLVSTGVVIKTTDLAKMYQMGAEEVHALRGRAASKVIADRRQGRLKNAG